MYLVYARNWPGQKLNPMFTEKTKKELITERLEMMAKAAGQYYNYIYGLCFRMGKIRKKHDIPCSI